MKHLSRELEKLFEELKNHLPDFNFEIYGDVEYFCLGKGYKTLRAIKQSNGKIGVFIKNKIEQGFRGTEGESFLFPKDYDDAKQKMFKLYDIKKTSLIELSDVIDEFESALFEKGVKYERTPKLNKDIQRNMVGYKHLNHVDGFNSFWLTVDQISEHVVAKVRNTFPYKKDCEEIFDLQEKSGIFKAVRAIRALFRNIELYDHVKNMEINLIDAAKDCGYEIIDESTSDYCYTLTLRDNKKERTIRIKDLDKKYIIPCRRDLELAYLPLSEENVLTAFDLIKNGNYDGYLEDKKTANTNNKDFAIEVSKVNENSSIEDIQKVTEVYDQIDEDIPELQEKFENLWSYKSMQNNIPFEISSPVSKRNIFATKDFIEALQRPDSLDLTNIVEAMTSFNVRQLYEHFVSSNRLCYINKFLKIRISNGKPHRIVFVFGDKLGGDPNDIYLYDYIFDHDFSYLKDRDPFDREYTIWKRAKPILDDEQEEKAEHYKKLPLRPLICTGCAGSGKTLISIEMYENILNDWFYNVEIKEKDLVYVTYNENTVNSVINIMKDDIKDIHALSIKDFFLEILEEKDVKLSDEHDFYNWWNNKYFVRDISSYQLREKYENITNRYNSRISYIFFRGLFKGSLFRWELSPLKTHLDEPMF